MPAWSFLTVLSVFKASHRTQMKALLARVVLTRPFSCLGLIFTTVFFFVVHQEAQGGGAELDFQKAW